MFSGFNETIISLHCQTCSFETNVLKQINTDSIMKLKKRDNFYNKAVKVIRPLSLHGGMSLAYESLLLVVIQL